MLTIWKMYTQLEKYTEAGKDDYYTRSAGAWHGAGAERLGLTGEVRKEDFTACRSGVDPRSGEILVPPASNGRHKDGYDLTFSSAKGLSMLKELGSEQDRQAVIEARRIATERTMRHIEDNYIYVRETHDGKTELVRVGNMVYASFEHSSSREGDMQDHVHCAVMNEAYNPRTGKWQAIEGNVLMQNEHYLGQYWRNEYAKELKQQYQERGEDIILTSDHKGLFDTTLFSAEEKKYFSTRRGQIEERAEALRQEMPHAAQGRINEVANLQTRKEKDENMDIELKREQWRGEARREFDLSAEKIRERMTTREVQKIEKEAENPQMNQYDYVRAGAQDLTENESVYSREDLLRHAGRYSIGEYTISELQEAAKELVKDRELVHLGREYDERKKVWRERMTTQEVQKIEKDVIRQAREGQGKAQAIATPEKAKEELAQYEAKTGRALRDDQRRAAEMILTSPDRYVAVQGDAGTGKTTMLDAVRYSAGDQHYWDVTGVARTGQAAKELEDNAQIESRTVHSFLASEPDHSRRQLWIVDEAAMTGSRQLHEIMARAEKENAKVVLVGDTKQLQAIEAGPAFQKLQESGAIRTERMQDVVRQDGEYRAVSEALAEKKIDKAIDGLESRGRIKEIPERGERLQAVRETYLDRPDYRQAVIVTARNADRRELNEAIREDLKGRGKVKGDNLNLKVRQARNVSETDKRFAQSYKAGDIIIASKACTVGRAGKGGKVVEVDEQNHRLKVEINRNLKEVDLRKDGNKLSIWEERKEDFSKGDRIVFLKNDKSLELKNGFQGTVEHLDSNGQARVRLDSGRDVSVNLKTQYNYIDHGYAVTEYKAQGASKRDVIYHADVRQGTDYNKAYMAITRGRKDVHIITDNLHDKVDEYGEKQQGFVESLKREHNKTWTGDYEKSKAEFKEVAAEKIHSSEIHGGKKFNSAEIHGEQTAPERSQGMER